MVKDGRKKSTVVLYIGSVNSECFDFTGSPSGWCRALGCDEGRQGPCQANKQPSAGGDN